MQKNQIIHKYIDKYTCIYLNTVQLCILRNLADANTRSLSSIPGRVAAESHLCHDSK